MAIRKIEAVLLAALLTLPVAATQAQVPAAILGKWRIQRILPTQRISCWDTTRANTLLGTTLTYQPHAMTWQGGEIPLNGLLAVSRTLSRKQFSSEYTLTLDDLGIHSGSIVEIDLQHEDADITGSTTEVPGDTILLAAPGKIVVSACGTYYEAIRAAK